MWDATPPGIIRAASLLPTRALLLSLFSIIRTSPAAYSIVAACPPPPPRGHATPLSATTLLTDPPQLLESPLRTIPSGFGSPLIHLVTVAARALKLAHAPQASSAPAAAAGSRGRLSPTNFRSTLRLGDADMAGRPFAEGEVRKPTGLAHLMHPRTLCSRQCWAQVELHLPFRRRKGLELELRKR